MHVLSLLALLLPFVAANDKHTQCDCMSWTKDSGWIHNADLTHYVCKVHLTAAEYNSHFDKDTGRCVTNGEWKIKGQDWEDACKKNGQDGYFELTDAGDNKNLLLHKVGAATGDCNY
ncbi:hypothetical protein E4U10_003411 [Claviceps purpurea]|nr:hypothetical protein E4U10_003411 [Claviceps purpurea]